MKFRATTVLLALFVAQAAFGQEPGSDSEAEAETSSQSGYEDLAEFGGPESVSAELKRNDAERESLCGSTIWAFVSGENAANNRKQLKR